MPTVIRAQVGRVVPIRVTARRIAVDATAGQRERINGCRITVLNPDGTTRVNAGVPVYERKGVFTYYFDTTGLPSGDYEVQARLGAGFNTASGTAQNKVQRSFHLRLVTTL